MSETPQRYLRALAVEPNVNLTPHDRDWLMKAAARLDELEAGLREDVPATDWGDCPPYPHWCLPLRDAEEDVSP